MTEKKLHTGRWIVVLTLHMIFWAVGTVALIPVVFNDAYTFVSRANLNYWWYWINMYVSIRIQIKMLLPLMEKHMHEEKPGYLDPYIERLKTWTRSRVLSAG